MKIKNIKIKKPLIGLDSQHANPWDIPTSVRFVHRRFVVRRLLLVYYHGAAAEAVSPDGLPLPRVTPLGPGLHRPLRGGLEALASRRQRELLRDPAPLGLPWTKELEGKLGIWSTCHGLLHIRLQFHPYSITHIKESFSSSFISLVLHSLLSSQ